MVKLRRQKAPFGQDVYLGKMSLYLVKNEGRQIKKAQII